jgi:hypothetical protein
VPGRPGAWCGRLVTAWRGWLVMAAIADAGGGLVEAYPEQVDGRDPQRGAYLHTGPETAFEEFGFVRDRRVAKWRWVMRLRVSA